MDNRFSELVKEFLIEGPNSSLDRNPEKENKSSSSDAADGPTNLALLNAIKSASSEYISKLQKQDMKTKKMIDALHAKQSHVREIRKKLEAIDLLPKLKEYNVRLNTIRFFELSHLFDQLEATKDVIDIPPLVITIVRHAPPVIPTSSTIHTRVVMTVKQLRAHQLSLFHTRFENHLAQESKPGETASVSSWVHFLKETKHWLLAYTCLSLLPVLLTDSQSLVKERYQEALDEALTPLWARLHFHLSIACETAASVSSSASSSPAKLGLTATLSTFINGTYDNDNNNNTFSSSNNDGDANASSGEIDSQITDALMWTFSYAKNFLDMLLNLCREITSAGSLQQLYPCAYQDVARVYIIEKGIRFLRAHVADIFVKFQVPMQSNLGFLMLLVEHAFDIDGYFNTHQPLQIINVCHILYDAKSMFYCWLRHEHGCLVSVVGDYLKSSRDVYTFEFGVSTALDPSSHSTSQAVGSETGNTSGSVAGMESGTAATNASKSHQLSSNRCYRGVYQCMKLFILASQRYQYLPKPAQDMVNLIILEPLLSLCTGLFLLRIKSSTMLYAISNRLHYYLTEIITTDIVQNYKLSNQYPIELQDFMASINYFQRCIHHSANQSLFTYQASTRRYDEYWKRTQNWFPRDKISKREYDNGPFSPAALLHRVMDIPDWEQVWTYEKTLVTLTIPMIPAGGTDSHTDSTNTDLKYSLGQSIETARAQVLTLSHVLEKQLQKHMLKF